MKIGICWDDVDDENYVKYKIYSKQNKCVLNEENNRILQCMTHEFCNSRNCTCKHFLYLEIEYEC